MYCVCYRIPRAALLWFILAFCFFHQYKWIYYKVSALCLSYICLAIGWLVTRDATIESLYHRSLGGLGKLIRFSAILYLCKNCLSSSLYGLISLHSGSTCRVLSIPTGTWSGGRSLHFARYSPLRLILCILVWSDLFDIKNIKVWLGWSFICLLVPLPSFLFFSCHLIFNAGFMPILIFSLLVKYRYLGWLLYGLLFVSRCFLEVGLYVFVSMQVSTYSLFYVKPSRWIQRVQ